MSKKPVILAVDDEKDILYTLEAIGNAVGWKVYTENNSSMAVNRLKALKPDIVLMDYHMPQQNGVITLQKMRTVDYRVPIIVLTVDERQEVADKFLAAGASDFATKPIRVPDLVAVRYPHCLVDRLRDVPDLRPSLRRPRCRTVT